MTTAITIILIIILLAFVLFMLLTVVINKQAERLERQSQIIESLNIVIKSYEVEANKGANS